MTSLTLLRYGYQYGKVYGSSHRPASQVKGPCRKKLVRVSRRTPTADGSPKFPNYVAGHVIGLT